MTVIESRTHILSETNVKASVDKFLNSYIPKCKRRTHCGGDGENETQPKGDSIQFENRSNNVKKRVVTLYFMLKMKAGKPILHVISFCLRAKVI